MKKFSLVVLAGVLSVSPMAMAGNNDMPTPREVLQVIDNVFGKSNQNKQVNVSVGVAKDAEIKAYQACVASGKSDCFNTGQQAGIQNSGKNQNSTNVAVGLVGGKYKSDSRQRARVSSESTAMNGGAIQNTSR